MRIVIDMQGAQAESRFRGIGRYTLGFAQGVARNRGNHEVLLALNGLFPETIEPIRAAFQDVLPQENIRVWSAPGPVANEFPVNDARREAAELIREAFLASLKPDIIHICSLFEGYIDDAVSSISRFDQISKVSVSLYDFIPFLNPDHYLKPNPTYAQHYGRKIQFLKKAALYLAISEFSRQEGLQCLGMDESRIINASTAIGTEFHPVSIHDADATKLRQKFGLTRPFVLYTGGSDERKNLPGLIQAYADLPEELRRAHQLVFAGRIPEINIEALGRVSESQGIRADELCLTGYVTDEELINLYNLCQLFVFPSLHEGFGLPALEAMACGAPIIAANTSSLPEVVALEAALFDPHDVTSMTAKMARALRDADFRASLREHGLRQARLFSWNTTAERAIRAWAQLVKS